MDPPEAPSMPELVQEMHNLHIPLSNQEGEDKTSAIDSDDENISDGKMAPPKESSTPGEHHQGPPFVPRWSAIRLLRRLQPPRCHPGRLQHPLR